MKTSTLLLPIGICGTAIFLVSELGELPHWIPWVSHETLEVMGHFGIYACLGFVVARYLSICLGLGAVVLVLFTADVCGLYGITDEFHQLSVPGRSAQFLDVLADFLGGFCGASAYATWRHVTGGFGTWWSRPELATATAIRRAIPVLTTLVLVAAPAVFSWGLADGFLRSQIQYTWMAREGRSNGAGTMKPVQPALAELDPVTPRTGRLQQNAATAPDPSIPWETNQDLLDFVRVVSLLPPNR